MTLGRQTLCDIVSTVKNYKGRESGAKVAGINLEGPFIAMSKKGAQNPEFVRPGTAEEFDGLFDKSGGLVKLITIAPEAFDSAEFIKHASKNAPFQSAIRLQMRQRRRRHLIWAQIMPRIFIMP